MGNPSIQRIEKLINRITDYGLNSQVDCEDKDLEIKQLLVSLYAAFLNLGIVIDSKEYSLEPEFDYYEIRKNVQSNFPDLGWYSAIQDSKQMEPNVEVTVGDALDDLTDIIKDLLAIKWRMNNTSMEDAIWHFEFAMRAHSERHLVELLKYFKSGD